MATFASLLMKLAVDKSAYTPGLKGAKADADDFAVGVTQSMNQAAAAATNAAAQISAAQKTINGAVRDPATGRFAPRPGSPHTTGPAFDIKNLQAGTAATEEASNAVGGLNKHLETTKYLLASFLVLGFIHFLTDAASAAANFEGQMLLLHTQARATMAEVRLMTDAVMDMSVSVRTGPEQLAEALYHIESVGIRGARALQVLETSAQGARVGNASLTSVTNALVGALATGIEGVEDLSSAMGTLDAIVGTGNMTMEDFTRSLSSGVLATAKTFGISLQDIGAAMATMTDQAIPAREAATRLRMSIALMGAPTNLATQQLARIGLTATDIAEKMSGPEGLIGALRLLRGALDASGLSAEEQAQIIVRAFGGGRSSSGIMTRLGSIDLMQQKIDIINDTATKFPELVAAQAETAQAKFQAFGAAVDVLSINVGNTLMPVLTAVAQVLTFLLSNTELATAAFVALSIILTIIATKTLVGIIGGMVSSTMAIVGKTAATLGLTRAMVGLTAAEGAAAVTMGGFTIAAGSAMAVLGPLAIALVAVGAAYSLITGELDKQTEALTKQTTAFATNQQTTLDMLKTARAGIQSELDRATQGGLFNDEDAMLLGAFDVMGVKDRLQRQLDILDSEISTRTQLAGVHAAQGLGAGLGEGADEFYDMTQTLVERFGATIVGVRDAAREAGGEAMLEMANEIKAHQDAPLEAFTDLHDMVRNQLDPMTEVARLYGMLISEDLAAGLNSGDPAVFAQAVATQKLITERLDEITGGAFSAGQNMSTNLGTGIASGAPAVQAGLNEVAEPINDFMMQFAGGDAWERWMASSSTAVGRTQAATTALANSWNSTWKPSADAIKDAMAAVNAELNKTDDHSRQLSAVRSAFQEVQRAAERYFDQVHRDNLRAIDDALKHKNALLDAKMALNQAPVTAAQKALDFRRQQIEEFRLREAIAKAQGPEEYRDAVLALQDFLAQKHIDQMQDQVDAANAQLQAQKDANQRRAEEQREAENRRYERMQMDFERQLTLLQRYLEKHPGEWQNTEEKIIALLRGYGFSYEEAGRLLTDSFVDGFRENLSAAEEAAKEYARAINKALAAIKPPQVMTGGTPVVNPYTGFVTGYTPVYQSGAWEILTKHLAVLDPGEMVVPAEPAAAIRSFSTRPQAVIGEGGGGGITVMVGDEVLAEITDKQMASQGRIYTRRGRVTIRSRR